MRTDQDEGIRQTYFGLRLAMLVLAVLLYLAVVIQLVRFGCLQSSLSDYYYTPARPVFIAALCAIGACLIIYRGTTTIENALLDVAGFVAFLIAFVPVGYPVDDHGCLVTNVPSASDTALAISNNGLALFLAGFLAVGLARRLRRPGAPPLPASTTVALLANVVLLLAGIAFFLLDAATFAQVAHPVAAVLFFLLTLAVMAENARDADPPYRTAYRVLFAITLVLALADVVAGLATGFRTWIFWAETIGIAGFAAFWLTQTRELGGLVNRAATRSGPVPPR